MSYYWTNTTQSHLHNYIEANLSDFERNKVYTNHLYPAFDSMIKGVMKRYKITSPQHSMDEMVSMVHGKVYDVIHSTISDKKYLDTDRNKSFEYFTSVIRNYLIKISNDSRKRENKFSTYEFVEQTSEPENKADLILYTYIRYIDHNLETIFSSDTDLKITKGFIEALTDKPESIESNRFFSRVVFKHVDLDEKEFYRRYYDCRYVLNMILFKIREKIINGKQVNNTDQIYLEKLNKVIG